MCWLSVLSTLFIKCVHYIFTYTIQSILLSLLGHIVGRIILTWFSTLQNTQMHWLELPSAFKLWFDIVTCLTKYFFSSAHICGIIYLSHIMITELKAFHLKVVLNCYWYTDHTHCPSINDALVTGHETWLAYENYIWLTVTSSLHIYPILIN